MRPHIIISGIPVTARSKDLLRDLLAVVTLYGVATAVYRFFGVSFDAAPATFYMQFIDPQLLRDRFLESLWYYHANPPMLNLLVGSAGKLFGGYQVAFLS